MYQFEKHIYLSVTFPEIKSLKIYCLTCDHPDILFWSQIDIFLAPVDIASCNSVTDLQRRNKNSIIQNIGQESSIRIMEERNGKHRSPNLHQCLHTVITMIGICSKLCLSIICYMDLLSQGLLLIIWKIMFIWYLIALVEHHIPTCWDDLNWH